MGSFYPPPYIYANAFCVFAVLLNILQYIISHFSADVNDKGNYSPNAFFTLW